MSIRVSASSPTLQQRLVARIIRMRLPTCPNAFKSRPPLSATAWHQPVSIFPLVTPQPTLITSVRPSLRTPAKQGQNHQHQPVYIFEYPQLVYTPNQRGHHQQQAVCHYEYDPHQARQHQHQLVFVLEHPQTKAQRHHVRLCTSSCSKTPKTRPASSASA